jgi:hypothetical protein
MEFQLSSGKISVVIFILKEKFRSWQNDPSGRMPA